MSLNIYILLANTYLLKRSVRLKDRIRIADGSSRVSTFRRANGWSTGLLIFSQPTSSTEPHKNPHPHKNPKGRLHIDTRFLSTSSSSQRHSCNSPKMTSSPSQNVSQRYPQRSSFDIRGIAERPLGNRNGIDFVVAEENLIAIGEDVRRETGNDVFKTDPQLNEWMQRVRKLGGTTDLDDDERAQRLEEVLYHCQETFSRKLTMHCRKFLHRGKRDRNDGPVIPLVRCVCGG